MLAVVSGFVAVAPAAAAAAGSPGPAPARATARATAPAPAKPAATTAPQAPAKAAATSPVNGQTPEDSAASAKAKSSGKPVEVASRTSQTSQITAQPDGTFVLTESNSPVRVKQNGSWVPLDLTLVRHADGSISPKASPSTAVFSGGGDSPAVTMSQGSKKVSMSWPAALPAPVLSGPTATYPNVLPGVDLRLDADSVSFHEVLVVHDAAAAADPALAALQLTLTGTGVNVKVAADGSMTAVDETGTEVFHAAAPMMWDSASDPNAGPTPSATDPGSGHRTKVGVTVAGTHAAAATAAGPNSVVHLALVPPAAALTGPGKTFPLYVDPEVDPTGALYWAAIDSQGYNTYQALQNGVGYCGWPGCHNDVVRSYFEMDTSAVSGAHIFSAYFYPEQIWNASSSATPVQLCATDRVFSSTNWGNKPACAYVMDTQSSAAGHNCPNGPGTSGCSGLATVQLNAFTQVNNSANGRWSNITFGLQSPSESNDADWKQYAGKASGSTAAPTLKVVFSYPPSTPAWLGMLDATSCDGNNITQSTNPTLLARSDNNNGESVNLSFEVYSVNTGAKSSSGSTGLVGQGVQNRWQVTSALSDGQYRWHVMATNSSGLTSAWSDSAWGWQYFSVLHSQTIATPTVSSGDYPQTYWGTPAGTAGGFSVGNNGSGAVGYAYAFDTGTPPTPSLGDCSYRTGPGNQAVGYVPANNGGATITPPPSITGAVGRHTLTVTAFDAARNPSGTSISYPFFVAPGYGANITTKFEADASNTSSVTDPAAGLGTGGPNVQTGSMWSGGAQIWFGGSNSAATKPSAPSSFALTFTTTLDADYAISTQQTQSFDYGMLKFDLDGTPLAGTDKNYWNGYSPSARVTFLDLGGAHLSPGQHKLTMTIMDTDQATANSPTHQRFDAGLDFLRVVPINGVTMTSFGAAMNNVGISDETTPATGSFDDLSGLRSGGTAHSYSQQQLTAAGWGPGQKVTVDGATFTMPKVAPGTDDNVIAVGQTFPLDPQQRVNASAIGFLVSGTCAGSGLTGATGVVAYSNGGTGVSGYTMPTVPDWIGGPAGTAAVTLPRWNNGGTASPAHLYAVFVPVDSTRTLSSITLPAIGSGFTAGSACYGLHVFAIGVRPADRVWTGAWASSTSAAYNLTSALGGQTLRIQAHPSLSGGQARIRLENTGSPVPVKIGHAGVANQSSGSSASGQVAGLTFGGQTQVTIAAGGEAVSDPVSLPVTAGGNLLVSLYLPDPTTWAPVHDDARADMYLASGDHVGDATGAAFTATRPYSAFLTGVDVATAGATSPGTVVALGDQNTAGGGTTPNAFTRWSEDLATLTGFHNTADGRLDLGVVNAGIDGNQLFTDQTSSAAGDPGGTPGGVSALSRLDRDVTAQSNAADVIVAVGADDILAGASTTAVEAHLQSLYSTIHQSVGYRMSDGNDFIRVFTATIPPIPGVASTDAREAVRTAVNADIIANANRYSDPRGKYVDFDAAVHDTTGHAVIPAYLTNGQPNDQYHAALAQAVLTAFNAGKAPLAGPAAPSASLAIDQTTGPAPLTVTVDGGDSRPGNPNAPLTSLAFDFGDGSTPVTLTSSGTTWPNGTGTTHTYTAAGTYPITLTATDAKGGSAVTTVQVTVAPQAAPTAALALAPAAVQSGQQMTADAGGSTPGANPISTYTFDFGDGVQAGPQSGATATHTYTGVGTYTVTVTVTDSNNLTATATKQITVSAAPPTAALTVTPASAAVGTQVVADASASAPGTAAITAYAFDFGDGVTVPAGPAKTATHAYTAAGVYTVKATATDANGLTSTATQSVTATGGPGVPDGDFETGSLAGWSGAYNADITTVNPHSGTYAGVLTAPAGGNAAIERIISGLTPNTAYTLSGWVRTDGSSTILGVKQFDTAGDETGDTTTATGWTRLFDAFTTGATNTSADIYCYRSTAGTSACDDITLTVSSGAILNGDFETGSLAGWSTSYNADITAANPHSGTYAGVLTAPTGGNAAIEQVVGGLTPNTAYTLSGWVRTDGTSTILGAKQYESTGADSSNVTTATGWTRLFDTFTTGATNTSADIYCYRSTAGTSACDDITLTVSSGAVLNGDFETGSLAGWSGAYNADITAANPHSGTYAGVITAPAGGNAVIEQVVSGLTPSTAYTLTGWVRTDGTSTILGAKQYESTGDNTDATTTATGWTQLTDTFTTGATNTSVDIYCYRSTAGTSACDDITLAKS